MTPSTALIVAIAVTVLCITAFAVFTAFGPPAKELQDPFDMHED